MRDSMPAIGRTPEMAGGIEVDGKWRRRLGALLAFLWLSALWNLPVEIAHFQPRALGSISLEVVLLTGLLALLPWSRHRIAGAAVRHGFALATVLILALKSAEVLIRSSLARPLNPIADVRLAPSVVHLLTGMLGDLLGWLALAGAGLGLIVVFALSALAVRQLQRALDRRAIRRTALVLTGALASLWLAERAVPERFASWQPVSAHASDTLIGQWQRSAEIRIDLRTFQQRAARDAFRDLPKERLLAGLAGTDVLLVFVESYGRSALEQPRYAATVLPTLDVFQEALDNAGLASASRYLTSPTVGGQSWLAHGTLESGFWISSQRLYELLVADRRILTLTRAFAKAGHRTVAVKPAITMPWPEGPLLGFQQVYAAKDLGYGGKPYNWVTMPDQYTLAALERLERGAGHDPLFVEVSLISSHAPWTPIPPVLDDWGTIGDGAVFSRWAELGDPPEVVWREPEHVREQYILAIDYVLNVLASYAPRFVDERMLLIVVGDHQPAPIITGEGASRDVPIHVISRDPALIEPFLAWGFSQGMRPGASAPVRRMDEFRDFFLDAFSDRPDTPLAASTPDRG
jgi:hypothetical protein